MFVAFQRRRRCNKKIYIEATTTTYIFWCRWCIILYKYIYRYKPNMPNMLHIHIVYKTPEKKTPRHFPSGSPTHSRTMHVLHKRIQQKFLRKPPHHWGCGIVEGGCYNNKQKVRKNKRQLLHLLQHMGFLLQPLSPFIFAGFLRL